jgi:L-ascorbate metabolism protein UlaG (beta-lactamase superfamily)
MARVARQSEFNITKRFSKNFRDDKSCSIAYDSAETEVEMSVQRCLSLIALAVLAAALTACPSSPKAETKDLASETTGKTLIKRISTDRSYGTSFLIVSKNGTTVVLDPYEVSPKIDPKKVDAIAVTHSHDDHQDAAFMSAVTENKGMVLTWVTGKYTVKDVVITGIASSHFPGEVSETEPTNVLYLIEVDGLRIVHMGDIGQGTLTTAQLDALGKIDIAFMQLVNEYSSMTLSNRRGFKILEQFYPQVVILTHTTAAATKELATIYGGLVTMKDEWAVSLADLGGMNGKVVDLK